MTSWHSREAFYALDNPLEAAVFSVLVELVKKVDKTNIPSSVICMLFNRYLSKEICLARGMRPRTNQVLNLYILLLKRRLT